MIPFLFGRGGSQPPQIASEYDTWYVTQGIQDTYDAIVRETDDWRTKALTRKKPMFSFLSRKKPMVFFANQSTPPRLYRLKDDQAGEISFELTEVEGGGTAVKTTYEPRARVYIQNFKAKLPTRIPSSGPKVCPTCGKEMLPDFKVCPFCGTKIK